MKTALITACLGGIDLPRNHVKQNIDVSVFQFDDNNYPPRVSMKPRIQAKTVRMFGWEFAPGFDYYIWIDSSFRMCKENSTQWLIDMCGDKDIAFFKHPIRNTPQEEKECLEKSMNEPYISARYKNEIYNPDWFGNYTLFATGIIIYKPTDIVKTMMKEWFFQVARYHSNDQLSLSSIVVNMNIPYALIDKNIYRTEYFKHYGHSLLCA